MRGDIMYRSRAGVWHMTVLHNGRIYLKCNRIVGHKRNWKLSSCHKVTCKNCLRIIEWETKS